jgi:hypothetical protein
MTITFTILPVIPSNVPAHRLRLPPFEASTEDKRRYLQQVFPDDQISEFDPDDLFAYYCASTVQWMVRPDDRSDFLNRYAQLMAGQLDTRYYDSLTSQGNTIIFNAVESDQYSCREGFPSVDVRCEFFR